MTVMMMSAERLRDILHVGKLIAGRSVRKVSGELSQLTGGRGISVCGCGLRGALQIGGNLLRYLLILRGVRLLKLLQGVHHLGEWRKLAAVGLLRNRGCAGGLRRVACESQALEGGGAYGLVEATC